MRSIIKDTGITNWKPKISQNFNKNMPTKDYFGVGIGVIGMLSNGVVICGVMSVLWSVDQEKCKNGYFELRSKNCNQI